MSTAENQVFVKNCHSRKVFDVDRRKLSRGQACDFAILCHSPLFYC